MRKYYSKIFDYSENLNISGNEISVRLWNEFWLSFDIFFHIRIRNSSLVQSLMYKSKSISKGWRRFRDLKK
jgi:hypothetical protein